MTSRKLIQAAKSINDLPVEIAYDESAYIPDNESEDMNTQAPIISKPEPTPVEVVVASEVKGFRFTPNQAASSILDSVTDKTGFSKADVLNVALVLMQGATEPEIMNAIRQLMADKTASFMSALK